MHKNYVFSKVKRDLPIPLLQHCLALPICDNDNVYIFIKKMKNLRMRLVSTTQPSIKKGTVCLDT